MIGGDPDALGERRESRFKTFLVGLFGRLGRVAGRVVQVVHAGAAGIAQHAAAVAGAVSVRAGDLLRHGAQVGVLAVEDGEPFDEGLSDQASDEQARLQFADTRVVTHGHGGPPKLLRQGFPSFLGTARQGYAWGSVFARMLGYCSRRSRVAKVPQLDTFCLSRPKRWATSLAPRPEASSAKASSRSFR